MLNVLVDLCPQSVNSLRGKNFGKVLVDKIHHLLCEKGSSQQSYDGGQESYVAERDNVSEEEKTDDPGLCQVQSVTSCHSDSNRQDVWPVWSEIGKQFAQSTLRL